MHNFRAQQSELDVRGKQQQQHNSVQFVCGRSNKNYLPTIYSLLRLFDSLSIYLSISFEAHICMFSDIHHIAYNPISLISSQVHRSTTLKKCCSSLTSSKKICCLLVWFIRANKLEMQKNIYISPLAGLSDGNANKNVNNFQSLQRLSDSRREQRQDMFYERRCFFAICLLLCASICEQIIPLFSLTTFYRNAFAVFFC